MAVFRPLAMRGRPIVVDLPCWLYSELAVGCAFDALKRAAGPRLVVVRDASRLVGVLHHDALGDPAVEAAHGALVDELTVWRLATDDGRRRAPNGYGVSNAAHCARSHARQLAVAS